MLVDVIFEHSPYPGKGTYNGPLIERGKTWVASLDGKKVELATLEEKTTSGEKVSSNPNGNQRAPGNHPQLSVGRLQGSIGLLPWKILRRQNRLSNSIVWRRRRTCL